MHYLEIIASISGLISTWLYVKQNHWSWPVGMLMLLIYPFVFYHVRLYADMLTQIVFLILQCYGWWAWFYGGKDNQALGVTRIEKAMFLRLLVLGVSFTLIIIYTLKNYTNGQLIAWDVATTVASFIAQWLLARKIIETWILWFVIDMIYLGMYLQTHLYFTCMLYSAFLFLAIQGYFYGQRDLNEQSIIATPM